MTDLAQLIARTIARELGDDFDHAFISKSDWNAARGMSGDRFRDINEPFQGDYICAAAAVLRALQAQQETSEDE